MMNIFMKAYGGDYKSICLLKITLCGRDLAQLFKSWITQSTGYIFVQWITQLVSLIEGVNGANRQASNGLKFNRIPSKM